MESKNIFLKNVTVHNLKNVTLTLPKGSLTVFTGVSGSGKSSLAFDTLYVEGQRRYVESLSVYARRQMEDLIKPELEIAEGLTPTISIEQKTAGKNPRSTVGTLTEIYDFLRVLYARIATPYCPISLEPVKSQSFEKIIRLIQGKTEGVRLIILSPFAENKKGAFKEDFEALLKKGFMRVRVDGQFLSLTDEISLDPSQHHTVDVVIDRIVISKENHSRIAEAVTSALNFGNGLLTLFNPETNEEELFSTKAYSPKSGISYNSLDPQDFSFNSPSGMCEGCSGLGRLQEFKLDLIIDPNKSLKEDCCVIASSFQTVRYGNIYTNLARLYDFDLNTPWKHLSKEAKKVFLFGTEKKWTKMRFIHPETFKEWDEIVRWRGVIFEAHQRMSEAKSDAYRKKMGALMEEGVCQKCLGSKLKPYPAAASLQGKKIHELTQMTIGECLSFFENLSLSKEELIVAEELLKEIKQRLFFLTEVGLDYLTLDRTAPTLSGGEAQRVRLASQIGCGLVGITYILDEPSIGLHPRDNEKLIKTLKHLRDIGNTVIVVEHDEETIFEADHIVDFGPGAGLRGGEVIVNGPLKELLTSDRSLTGAYLSGKKNIPIPKKRRKPTKKKCTLLQASHHNLKNVTLEIPLGLFVAVTGVSGSGKSSLITETLYPALANALQRAEMSEGSHKGIKGLKELDKVISVDQTPIGRTPRSNPATYIKLFDEIRDLFTQLPESKARGYLPGRFSFNVKEGCCEECLGQGEIKIDMDFMEDAFIVCPSCEGKRFDKETLSIYYKGKNISDILNLTVDEALPLFNNIPSIFQKLSVLEQVGLGYLKLGQSSTTLSGGEAQRIKLAKELVRPSTGKTFYILDEPTTGLHFEDIKHLLENLHKLVDQGNTVLVIEHNMDVVKTADWILDIGPEGGQFGGELVAKGAPELIASYNTPTGHALKKALFPNTKERLEKILNQKETKKEVSFITDITIEGASQNNLKHLSLKIPRGKITVCTGPSGSGKSSLAFDTIFAEGQRRYTESLSSYARQFVKQMPKPKLSFIEGLSPAIAIEQKAHAGNPRSTVGTLTEIYDYLRVLFAKMGVPHCPETLEVIESVTKEKVVETLLKEPLGEKIQILSPIPLKPQDEIEEIFKKLKTEGFLRVRLNNTFYHLEEVIPFDKKRKNTLFLVIDRLKIEESIRSRLFQAVELATKRSGGKLTIAKETEDLFFNLSFSVKTTGKSYPEITPQTFAFNKKEGACEECFGIGVQYGAHLMKDRELSSKPLLTLLRTIFLETESALLPALLFLDNYGISPLSKLEELSSHELNLVMNGSDEWISSQEGFSFKWIGINHALSRLGKHAHEEVKEEILPILEEHKCPSCQGTRLNPLARHVTINALSIADLCDLPINEAKKFINSLKAPPLLEETLKQIKGRLTFLEDVGLHYLSLNRSSRSLSGGETQRIRLAKQLGSSLTGCLYVLDEPTIGLHPHDNERLNKTLQHLKSLDNTLILVEHDPQTIKIADHIIDFGPQAGRQGGHITAQGTLEEILENKDSLTGAYLSKRISVSIPQKRLVGKEGLLIENANLHNLKNLSLKIPQGVMTCLTGVSGSGKSTLLQHIIAPAVSLGLLRENSVSIQGAKVSNISLFDRLIHIDQAPLGQTNRSNVATYTDILTPIRDLFASLPLAKMKGLQPKHFSYNQRAGMCTHCFGMGYKKIELFFLPPVKVVCEECNGLRLNKLSLQVLFKEKNLGEILQGTVEEARKLFENIPKIVQGLDMLISVGLHYLSLGQETASLSLGEAQRLKLSRELSKRGTGKTLYLLDEPTTGLHSQDIQWLLKVLKRLVDQGNTMIFIEHNLDMIQNADYVIDLGKEAGPLGGEIVAQGTPEEIAKNKNSLTGKYLSQWL